MLLALGRAPQINYINISQEREREEKKTPGKQLWK